jgi:hypothetical protein
MDRASLDQANDRVADSLMTGWLFYRPERVSLSRRSNRVTSTDGATCRALDSLQSTVIVGEWMPHSIWLM